MLGRFTPLATSRPGAEAIDPKTFDLSVNNPNGGEEITHRSPQEIMDEIAALNAESAEVLGNIKALL
jgi:type I restriction enzyme M protein